MPVAVIYHQEERDKADVFARSLEALGHEVALAPLGLEVGSPEWIDRVQTDLESADACLLLLTPKSVRDEWVAMRTQCVLNSEKRLCPIVMDASLPDESKWVLPSQVFRYNWLYCTSDRYIEPTIESLSHCLPKPEARLMCFISYSRADSDFARKLKTDLLEHQVDCWRDLDDIPAGASWDNEIEKAIKKCTHVLLVVSKKSVESDNVADEVGFARERKKAIIPLILEDAPLPLRVHRAQAIDFSTNYKSAFQRLLSNLRKGA